MNTLVLNTKNEFYKLMSKKKYFIVLIIAVIICVGRFGGGMLIAKLSGGKMVIKTNMLLEMLPMCTDIFAPLAIFMAVTDLFASEIQEDTMKSSLLKPVSRFKALTSKALAAFWMSVIYFTVLFAACMVLQIVSKSPFGIFHSLAAYAIDLIPLFALIFMAVLINLISKSSSLAMLLCIAVYALFKYMNYFVSGIGALVFTAYSQWHKLWLGVQLPFRTAAPKVGILFGSILILYVLSYIIFDKKDF